LGFGGGREGSRIECTDCSALIPVDRVRKFDGRRYIVCTVCGHRQQVTGDSG
jgi:DNA-directed RNA polymerase subunit RPC12/RpoP